MARIQQLRQENRFECLFWDDNSSHPLRLLLTQNVNLDGVRKHLDMLKAIQEREKAFFWQEAAASNLLAFLYMISGEEEPALEQLKSSLEKFPNNLNAIVGMIRIFEKQYRGSEADTKMDQHRTLTKDSDEMQKQINICQGEIAYACSFIGPDFYLQAVDRYEALLGPNSKVWHMKGGLNGYVVRWQYHLAYTYNRMLNKGHTEKLAEKLGTKDPREIFDKISKLYIAVIGSGDEFYTGKAMIDLVDTHKKCETSGKHQKIPFPRDSPDEYVKLALDTAPLDPHVLERCGRHYRQRASTKKELEQTIKIFDLVLEVHPSRHVAWHHKGLAYRALWHIVGKYKQANLYNNSARKGNKKRVRKQKALAYSEMSHRPTADTLATAAECCLNLNSISLPNGPNQLACEPPTVQFRSMSVDEGFCSMSIDQGATDAQESPSNSPEVLRTAPRKLPTLPPWKSQEIGDVPRQLKKPDFFDKLRTSNPPVTDSRSQNAQRYLEEARNCFKEAKAHSNGMCSPYVVDLARSLISLGLYDEAEIEFRTANSKLASANMNNNDAAYLYEQWALLRHSRVRQAGTPEVASPEMNDVAYLYRKAILSAVRARERSRVAFYDLRDLLREELQHKPDNPALKIEYDLLRNSAQNFKECKEILVEAMKDDATRRIAWHLITLLHDRRHEHDAATAFVYLTALHEAKQLNLDETEAVPDAPYQESNRQLLINVVRELVRDGDQTNADGGQTFGEIFRWMVGTGRISDYIRLDRDSPRPFAENGEICILAPSETSPGVDRVLRMLRDVCGMVVVRAFCEGNCDIPWGSPTSEGLRAVVAISQAVVVIEHSTDTDNWKQLFPVLEELMGIKEVKACLVADEKSDYSNTEQRFAKRWPRLTINCDDSEFDDIEFAYRLFKTMFP